MMSVKNRGNKKSASTSKPQTENASNNEQQQYQPPRVDFRRLSIRMVLIAGILLTVYFSKEGELVTFVSQKEEVKVKSASIDCSQDYVDEVKQFPGCAPQSCGRVVFDSVISYNEVMAMRSIAERGLKLGGSSGGASILDLHSGALSHGNTFINIYKLSDIHKVFNDEDFKIYSLVKNKIKQAIVEHFNLDSKYLYLTHPTFFSRITDAPAKTIHDEYWHPHVDKETYESFHYTSLLYLNDYKLDFDGGRFVFIDKGSNKTVEPRSGRVSAFTSGSENLHHVEQLKHGVRYAITVSFTCDPSHGIKDPQLPPR